MIIKQVRYYNEDQKKELNSPEGLTAEQLISGEYFEPIICSEIRIQCAPGVIVYLNDEEVHIGELGYYQILKEENVSIATLKVKEESIERIKNDTKGYFIVTFILQE